MQWFKRKVKVLQILLFKDITVDQEGAYTALQVGKKVFVTQNNKRIFETKGTNQWGQLKDLFVLHEGMPYEASLIVVKNSRHGLMMFSDLWNKFDDGSYGSNIVDAHDSGRIFYEPQTRIVSKTAHHYAVQEGNEVVLITANNYDNQEDGYHESYRMTGTLRRFIIFDCCGYAVMENADRVLIVTGFGEEGPGVLGKINLQ